MLQKIEHIGIAVRSIQSAGAMFEKLAEAGLLKIENVESEGVKVAFFQVGETKIEFLEASSPDSPISKFIEKNGEGIHHIAFATDDMQAEMQRLGTEGFEFIQPAPKDGADNKLICFLHPRSTNRVLVELCQEKVSA
jgi:methylmalonyl-CoA/ethylmalonyl-CoA epimerase